MDALAQPVQVLLLLAVVFIARSDGNVDIWDFMDSMHKPTTVQMNSSSCYTNMVITPIAQKADNDAAHDAKFQ